MHATPTDPHTSAPLTCVKNMPQHRLLLPLAALLSGCLFSVEPVSAPADMAVDLAAEPDQDALDQGRSDQGSPDQDAPDQAVCPEVECVPGCAGGALVTCALGEDGCVTATTTACGADERCDAPTASCVSNPCSALGQIVCDPAQPDVSTRCESVDGQLVPGAPTRCPEQTVCAIDAATGCAPFECQREGEVFCAGPMALATCTREDGSSRLVLASEACPLDTVCDGASCQAHECGVAELNTIRCSADYAAEEQCQLNASGRRVWTTLQRCGDGAACAASTQRCGAHQCDADDAASAFYCATNRVVARCSLDGGRYVRADLRTCAGSLRCEASARNVQSACVCDDQCVPESAQCGIQGDLTRYRRCEQEQNSGCYVWRNERCPQAMPNLPYDWDTIGCFMPAGAAGVAVKQRLDCFTKTSGHCGFQSGPPCN